MNKLTISKTETLELMSIFSKMKNGMKGIKSRRDPTVAICWKIHRGEKREKNENERRKLI